jgi:hypothetical protein
MRLITENNTYGDLVILNVTENMNEGKAYYHWKWIGEHLDTTQYDYVAKADDDAFIHFQNLALNLRPLPRDHLYYGYKSWFFIRGMLEVLSINHTRIFTSIPFNETEWIKVPEDHALGVFLNKYDNSTLKKIGENCLFFTDPRVPSNDIPRPWASPHSIVIHWLKDVPAWKGVVDLYFPKLTKIFD